MGLIIVAGEPRAIDDAVVLVGGYALWRVIRRGRGRGPAALSLAAGLVLGVGLGAVQWLPGLAAVSTSQRGTATMALFNSGSLPHRWLLLMLVPDLLGGSGSFGEPGLRGALQPGRGDRLRRDPATGRGGGPARPATAAGTARPGRLARLPEWLVWHVLALAGVVLALGGDTPLGRVLVAPAPVR